MHEVTSAQAFEGLRLAGRKVRRPDRTLATADHNVPTDPRERTSLDAIADHLSRKQVEALERNCEEFGIPLYGMRSRRQGIVHVIGPELGVTQPGITIACGDSHTSTHGALGALAMPVGTSEVEHVLATQCLPQVRPKTMRITYEGEPGFGVTAKDLILGTIGQISAAGAVGYAVEYAGAPIAALSVEGRMTICNMSIEAGARAGMIAPDDTTFEYVEGRPGAPADYAAVVERWRSLPTRSRRHVRHARSPSTPSALSPQVTWGTNPGQVVPVTGRVPTPTASRDRPTASPRSAPWPTWRSSPARRSRTSASTASSSGRARTRASRTCARPPRWSAAGGSADTVHAMVVPGSMQVKAQAEQEGLDEVFKQAGFDWREAGCSMCLGMNPDILQPGERCASTSNRNFEGRQGRGGRTHLVSPQMAAAAAVEGHFVDVREWK